MTVRREHGAGHAYWETPFPLDLRSFEGDTPESLARADEVLGNMMDTIESRRKPRTGLAIFTDEIPVQTQPGEVVAVVGGTGDMAYAGQLEGVRDPYETPEDARREERAAKMAHEMAVHLVDVFSPNYSDERVNKVAEKIRAIMREEYERGDA